VKKYTEEVIRKAKKLREEEKLSFRELNRRINVRDTTLSGWCHGTIGNRWDTTK
jgi:transcriptional regulator with XRE-family HTH domain